MRILDYDDMCNAGLIKTASVTERTCDDKYAVILVHPKTKTGKFCITTKTDTENSIYALSNNDIPEEIAKPAKYFVKQAAEHFGIEAKWTCEKCAREVKYNEVSTGKSKYKIKIAGGTFNLTDDVSIKMAEEFFIGNMHRINIPDRRRIALSLCKEGALQNYKPEPRVLVYAHPHLHDISSEIEYREKEASDNPKYLTALKKVASSEKLLDPVEFVNYIRLMDKAAGLKPEFNGHPYSLFFQPTPKITTANVDDITKIASIVKKGASEETIETIKKVI